MKALFSSATMTIGGREITITPHKVPRKSKKYMVAKIRKMPNRRQKISVMKRLNANLSLLYRRGEFGATLSLLEEFRQEVWPHIKQKQISWNVAIVVRNGVTDSVSVKAKFI